MLLWVASAWAETIEVPGEAATLAEAVEIAAAGDEIVLGAGVFPDLPAIIDKELVIRGQSRNNTAVVHTPGLVTVEPMRILASVTLEDLTLDGASLGTLLEVHDATLTLDDVQITQVDELLGSAVELSGSAKLVATDTVFLGLVGENGAISTRDTASLELTSCTFSANQAVALLGGPTAGGGALRLGGGPSTVHDSIFLGNHTGARGGAVLLLPGAELVVKDSRFEGNQGDEGGGAVAVFEASFEATDTTFLRNDTRSDGDGGALDLDGATVILIRPLFCGNEAQGTEAAGGAIYSLGGELSVSNGTFVANASFDEGAIRVLQGSALIDHCTFVENESQRGAALHFDGDGPYVEVTVQSSVISNNQATGQAAVQGTSSRPVGIGAIGFWHNQQYNTSGNITFLDPDLPVLTAEPFSRTIGDPCPTGPLLPTSDELLDRALDTDPDGSPGDLGATGGPLADPNLWVDCDGDSLFAWQDPDDAEGDCPPVTDQTGDTATPEPWRPPEPEDGLPTNVGCGCQSAPSGGPILAELVLLALVARGCRTSRGRAVRLR